MRQGKQQEPISRAKLRRYLFRSRLKKKGNLYTLRTRFPRTLVKLLALWIVAITIFIAGLSSAFGLHFFSLPGSKPSSQAGNINIPTSTISHSIFRIDGIMVTDTQWHQMVQSVFSTLASSNQFLGGSQTDSEIINTQAMHSILDPLAIQEIVKKQGLSTNIDVLYQQWLDQANLQEKQTAQENQTNVNYKQEIAQEQLKRNIVARLTTLPALTTDDVYTYYLQHPSNFARTAPQMHVQQIVVSTSQMAQKVVNQLKTGQPFSVVEAAYDMSGSYYKTNKGDLGWIVLGGSGFPPEWTGHVLSLQAGQISIPFLVDNKYYIVKCIEGPDYEAWPFKQIKEQARTDLSLEQLNIAFAHILAQQERNMNIVLLDQRYSTILQNFADMLKNE